MLESGPDEPQAPGNFCHQLTRVSKIAVFSQLAPFAKRPKRISFPKFQMPYGSFFNAVHKSAVRFEFRENSFFAILFRDPRILREFPKRAPQTLLAPACHPPMWGPLVLSIALCLYCGRKDSGPIICRGRPSGAAGPLPHRGHGRERGILPHKQQGPLFAWPAHPLQDVPTQSGAVIWINTVMGHQNHVVRYLCKTKAKKHSTTPAFLPLTHMCIGIMT